MKLLRGLSLYTLVGFLGAGINFFLMPVLSHHLSPNDYGLISIFNTYVLILIPLMSFMAHSSIAVSYFKEKEKTVFASKFLSVQLIPLSTYIFLSLLNLFFYYKVSHELELDGASMSWGFILLTITLLSIFVEQCFSFLILQKKSAMFFAYTLSKVFLESALTVFFVIYKGMGWQGRISSWFITLIVFFVLFLPFLKGQGINKGVIKWKYAREGLLFGLPLIVHNVGKFVVDQSDRIFIAKIVSLEEAGVYNIGYILGSMISLFSNAFFYVFSPFVLERLGDLTSFKALQIVKMSYLYVVAILGVLFIIAIFSPLFFEYFIDKRYEAGQKYVFWIGLAYVFYSFYGLFASYIMYYNKNSFLAWAAAFNIIINIIFNYFFIHLYGAIGAAYATSVSFFLVFITVAIRGNQLVSLPWLKFKQLIRVPLN